MKRKYIDGSYMADFGSFSSKCIHIEDVFDGYVSLIKAEKVYERLPVDYEKSDKILFDEGYKCLMFLPNKEKWCASVVYNTLNEVVEWYFDMTKQNSINAEGRPFYDDLYLDIAISPDFKAVILDEDELKEALEKKHISKSDYDMAYNTCNKLMKEIIPDKDFLVGFFRKYLLILDY